MFHFLVKGRLTKGASDVNETVYGNQPVEVVAPAAFMESEVEVDDYLMVDSDDVAAIPTMNTNFKVQ